jgi:pyruvate/2-oxoglutarate dehydrogenase complex dihydrolipoamide acyltransferase (E2) component
VVEITATQAGTIGWLIAIAAGIVLVGTTVLRIRQVGKERAAQEHEPEPLQVSRPSDPTDAPDTTKDTLDV